ncbi:MFS transporter [Novosphingobium mathurense]|nr:MFS transporter [Novosphingobium mathurense]
MPAAPMEARAHRLPRGIVTATIGHLVEWYDWYCYVTLSLYFAHIFFPDQAPTAQLLNTAGIFAIGFIMRPLGAWLLGLYADRRGRKGAMLLSVSLMCFGSLIVALVPGYASIGYAAPALLIFARLLQGLSLGGEYGTSATYLSEIARPDRRAFYGSFLYVMAILGQLLALGSLALLQFVILTPDQLNAWGWRIPFLLGAVGAVVVLFVRRNMAETEIFEEKEAKARERGTWAAVRRHKLTFLMAMGINVGGTVAFYTFSAYSQKFLVNSAGFSAKQSTLICTAALFLFMLAQPLFGIIADRIGRRPVLLWFGLLGTFGTVPIMTALAETRSPIIAFLLILAGLLIVSGFTATTAVVKTELFPTEIRAMGVSICQAITASLLGGTAEVVALQLKLAGHESWFYWYVSFCCAVSLLVYLAMKETRAAALRAEVPVA